VPEIVDCDNEEEGDAGAGRGARAVREGKLVAFPTETVYGLGADATDSEAVRAIFRAKDRPDGHPLIVHVDTEERAASLVREWPASAASLAREFWPGPLTVITEKSAEISEVVTGGLPTVGLRMPDHPVAQRLIELADRPVAAPSANLHGRLSPTRAEHVVAGLGDAVDVVLDGGPTEVGIESTVLSLAEDPPAILRPGMIDREAIEAIIGDVRVEGGAQDEGVRPSPGMSSSHYAPRAPLRLASPEVLRDRLTEASGRVGVVWCGEARDGVFGPPDLRTVLPDRPSAYATELYEVLHRLDRSGCHEIWVEEPPQNEAWRAVRDRLRRAATP